MKFRLFRTYSSLTLSNTGAGTSHNHGHTHASAAHQHDLFSFSANIGDVTVFSNWNDGNGHQIVLPANWGAPPNFAAFSTTPGATGSDSTGEASHTHSVSGTSILGVSESGTTTTISNIAIDGVDVTAQLPATATTPAGGPWANDFVDLDLTSLMPTGNGGWHVVSLTVTGLGRLMSILRLG